ncbi:energy-coupling factor transporter transmembrane protein EcfT [Methanococcoides sp. NM1]|uniref:energy-coupling factor transporter transmembrane component T family protein n=1 Tax=Methanococcoides sp. NM1 TaxID=1201013 RepID=UPI001082B20D|nr:energy-coupling factor transporter transmembrane component T [Methanococcoides sp. NM1]
MAEPLFSYVRGNSFLHNMDPRAKIISVMCLSILIFNISVLSHLFVLAVLFGMLTNMACVSMSVAIRSLRPMVIFFCFIFLIHLFFTDGSPIFSLAFSPTYEGLEKGTVVTGRFVLLILFGSLLTSTTRPALITSGIEHLLRPLPLGKLGTTSFEVATMMSLAIHFVPHLLWYVRQIKDAQMSRGLKYGHHPISGMLSLAIPALRGSMRMADDVALSMESRCYQGNYRTSLFEMKMVASDRFVCIFVVLGTALIIYT